MDRSLDQFFTTQKTEILLTPTTITSTTPIPHVIDWLDNGIDRRSGFYSNNVKLLRTAYTSGKANLLIETSKDNITWTPAGAKQNVRFTIKNITSDVAVVKYALPTINDRYNRISIVGEDEGQGINLSAMLIMDILLYNQPSEPLDVIN